MPTSKTAFALAIALCVTPTGYGIAADKATTKSAGFFLGADISALDSRRPGSRGMLSYQEDGKPSDEVTILSHHGWTAYRLRVFVSPVRSAPNNSLENTIPLAKQIKAMGATFVLDLHFSDTWADPQHQDIPVAWRGLNVDALAKKWE